MFIFIILSVYLFISTCYWLEQVNYYESRKHANFLKACGRIISINSIASYNFYEFVYNVNVDYYYCVDNRIIYSSSYDFPPNLVGISEDRINDVINYYNNNTNVTVYYKLNENNTFESYLEIDVLAVQNEINKFYDYIKINTFIVGLLLVAQFL
ncbi:hypothetical protein QKU48_gp1154 [Fadolivirus algeromassiliense]|jgi:hypothetical protein|uniref:Uncharacterized protein n=1 Tax=Fadolivirus FV1/VV64 TaxID=3070911 RepID=A0A7D3V602_9VIRU|nr:hypothetical protein QKU48_gp1154 [Fadolivirus algeromassiliense]QKF94612.1 hypothetical protein Fadolivirus_1_1154 [Fadolivirus FV1/VV64]